MKCRKTSFLKGGVIRGRTGGITLGMDLIEVIPVIVL